MVLGLKGAGATTEHALHMLIMSPLNPLSRPGRSIMLRDFDLELISEVLSATCLSVSPPTTTHHHHPCSPYSSYPACSEHPLARFSWCAPLQVPNPNYEDMVVGPDKPVRVKYAGLYLWCSHCTCWPGGAESRSVKVRSGKWVQV